MGSLVLLWVHLLAAAAWLGSALGVLVLAWGAGEASGPAVTAAARRLRFLGWRGVELVLLTGVFNVLARAVAGSLTPGFLRYLAVKAALVGAMVGLQVAGARADLADPAGAGRRRALWTAGGILGAGSAVLLLGLTLRSV